MCFSLFPLKCVPARQLVNAAVMALVLASAWPCTAQPAKPSPDVVVLSNGDTLHGELVSAVNGDVTFHSAVLGDIKLKWSDIKELRTGQKFAVMSKTAAKPRGRNEAGAIPVGTVDVSKRGVIVHEVNGSTPPLPTAKIAYIVDQRTLDQQVYHEPNFFTGWNGAATVGATIVQATQNQYTASGSIALVRRVPGVSWLDTRHRTSADFSGSYGKIMQTGLPTVKTSIYHADAERDQYFSSRFYAVGQVAFDHNFSQALALQSIFGGGIGWTAIKDPRQELDFKGTLQYAAQTFLAVPPAPAAPSQHLVGSTFSGNYDLQLRRFSFTQQAAFLPAYNTPRAYSASQSNTLAFPAYKNFAFSIGTLDTYLNDPPLTVPPTKRNSFQFTMGLTYAIKSKY